jgi:hypothetical protein
MIKTQPEHTNVLMPENSESRRTDFQLLSQSYYTGVPMPEDNPKPCHMLPQSAMRKRRLTLRH